MIYEFATDFSLKPQVRPPEVPYQFPTGAQQKSHIDATPPRITAGNQGRTDIISGRQVVDRDDIEDYLMPGFRSLDESMKMFWSGLRVPTKDAYRFMRVKIAGADKSVLIWRDELMNGRTRLPVAALNRTKEEFNKDKFSPPYHPMAIRYVSKRGNLAAFTYRPTPWLVDYTLSVWSEHKRDNEYILYQIMTRFNPLSEFVMFDGHVRGRVVLRFGGKTDQSDKEATTEQQRLLKYEYSITAEAWLPLPERLIPTVLGVVAPVKDYSGDILQFVAGKVF